MSADDIRIPFTEERSLELTMQEAALGLNSWEWDAVARLGASARLSFERNTGVPDKLLHTILYCASEIRELRSINDQAK